MIRRRAERITLAVMAGLGIVVLVADTLGWLDRLPVNNAIPKITLLVLTTVTVFLLLEVERFQSLDTIEARLNELAPMAIAELVARQLRSHEYAGLVGVHDHFSEDEFVRYVRSARRVTILNTWIPNLNHLEDSLVAAVGRRAEVRLLLLHPNSPIAGLRYEALRAGGMIELDGNVKDGVERCLDVLKSVAGRVDERKRSCLRVRVYHSLPSVSVYRADEHYLVGMFLHGKLAVASPQLAVDGPGTALSRHIQAELDTLWRIGKELDPLGWQGTLPPIER